MSNLDIMTAIQNQADADHETNGLIPLDAEGIALAEGKRFTFDVITVPVDPLR